MTPARIALGTAQFGSDYGVANRTGKVPVEEARMILDAGRRAGIDTVDTAILYGDSEATLGGLGVGDLRIITKLPGVPAKCGNVADWVASCLAGSLARLDVKRIGGLLLHRPADLLGPHGRELRTALMAAKSEGSVESVGYSIYDPEELNTLFRFLRPDIVQVPYNVFDRRIEASGWLARLIHANAEIHVRSTFLQGLLLMPRGSWPKYFQPWAGLLDMWLNWCEANGIPPACGAMQHAVRLAGVNRVVIGVDTVAQLSELIEMLESEAPNVPAGFRCDDEMLINPAKWMRS